MTMLVTVTSHVSSLHCYDVSLVTRHLAVTSYISAYIIRIKQQLCVRIISQRHHMFHILNEAVDVSAEVDGSITEVYRRATY